MPISEFNIILLQVICIVPLLDACTRHRLLQNYFKLIIYCNHSIQVEVCISNNLYLKIKLKNYSTCVRLPRSRAESHFNDYDQVAV